MQTEKSSGSELSSLNGSLRLLVILAFVVVGGSAIFALLVLHKLNRVAVVVEDVNAQVHRVVAAAAPLGKAAVEKGVKTLDAVDTEDLGQSATEGVKEIGRSAKEKVIDLIRQRQAEIERKSD